MSAKDSNGLSYVLSRCAVKPLALAMGIEGALAIMPEKHDNKGHE
jgi:hypothetical protein